MKKTSLHTGWQFTESGSETALGWMPAEVPGHVHCDLILAGVLADPFHRMQEFGSRWVDDATWTYRLKFDWTPDPLRPKRLLRFEGLDTICSVSLNGQEVGRFRNMFQAHEIDVTGVLRSGENELVVNFSSSRLEGEARRSEYFAAQGIAPDVMNFDERSFIRKAQYMFGWDWGPRLISCGIWKPVALLEFSSRIREVRVSPRLELGTWKVGVEAAIDGEGPAHFRLSDPAGRVLAEWYGDGEAIIEEPKLWWPHDLGGQPLYELSATLDGQSETRRFGLRTIELAREDDADGQSFQFRVNGVPVWARGANWIPDHSFPGTVTRERFFEQLGRAKAMGMNMLRVWGGGLYESDDFFDAADELGILVWQDFPFGCAYYPDTGEWQDVVREEASQNVRRLRHRASLALWCGNNENLTMWEGAWGGKDRQPPRYYGEHLYEGVLPEVLADLDPDRPYIPTSPWGGDGNCNQGGIGDQHYWDVWHGRGDWCFYADSTARFSSEFGFASSPGLEVWESCLLSPSPNPLPQFRFAKPREGAPESPSPNPLPQFRFAKPREGALDWEPYSASVRWHDKTRKGYETYLGMVHLHYPKIETMEDLVYYTQLNQRDAIRFAFEHYRSSELCKGALIWQLNDCWPVQSWAILDCSGRRKALGFELERICASRMIALKKEGDGFKVFLANESAEPWETEVFVEWIGANAAQAPGEGTRSSARVEPFSRVEALHWTGSGIDPTRTFLRVSAKGAAPTCRLLCEPKEFAGSCAPVKVQKHADGSASLAFDGPAVDVWVQVEGGGEVVPNFFSVSGGEVRVQGIGDGRVTAVRSLSGNHELVGD